MVNLAKLIVAAGRGQSEPPPDELAAGKNGRGKFLTRNDGKRVGKVCYDCHVLKHYDEFGKRSNRADGKNSQCKECINERDRINRQSKEFREKEREYRQEYNSRPEIKEYRREYFQRPEVKERNQERNRNYYEENKEWHREYMQEYRNRPENKEQQKEKGREHYENNPEQYTLRNARRRARAKALPDDMTDVQAAAIDDRFTCCPITGSTDTHEEHFIAIATGNGEGHSIRNVWKLDGRINLKKSDLNPFEFFRREDVIIDIITNYGRSREQIEAGFMQVVEYFADMNDMTVLQFEAYVNYCFDNRKTDEEIDAYNAAGQTVQSRNEFEAHTAAMSETIMQGGEVIGYGNVKKDITAG